MEEIQPKEKFSKYNDIESFHKRYEDIFSCKEIIANAKIHGSSMRVGYIDGEFRVGGRNQEFKPWTTGNFGMPQIIAKLILDVKLKEWYEANNKANIIIYGEVYGPGVQKLTYGLKEKSFAVFDIKLYGYYEDHKTVCDITSKLGLEVVPTLYIGEPNLDVLNELRSGDDPIAANNGVKHKREGIVIKPTRTLYNKYHERIIAKHKDPEFEERTSLQMPTTPKEVPVNFESITAFVDEFATVERLNHALSHLHEAGVEATDVRQTGDVIRAMIEDVKKEATIEMENLVKSGVEWKQVQGPLSTATRKLYHQYLEGRNK